MCACADAKERLKLRGADGALLHDGGITFALESQEHEAFGIRSEKPRPVRRTAQGSATDVRDEKRGQALWARSLPHLIPSARVFQADL